jgi:hypothetical protein
MKMNTCNLPIVTNKPYRPVRARCAEAALEELPREAKLALLRRLRAKLRALAAALAAEQGVRGRAVRAARRPRLPLACPCPAAVCMALHACVSAALPAERPSAPHYPLGYHAMTWVGPPHYLCTHPNVAILAGDLPCDACSLQCCGSARMQGRRLL